MVRKAQRRRDAVGRRAAQAALLAVTRGTPGIYNIAEDDGEFSIEKARTDLGFEPKSGMP